MSVPAAPANKQDQRRSTRYRSSQFLLIRCPGGSTCTGVSVEIGMRVGDMVELEPVAGGSAAARVRHKVGQLYGFEFVELGPEQVQRIAECCKISQAGRTRRNYLIANNYRPIEQVR
jgi:hypothetical protein